MRGISNCALLVSQKQVPGHNQHLVLILFAYFKYGSRQLTTPLLLTLLFCLLMPDQIETVYNLGNKREEWHGGEFFEFHTFILYIKLI